MFIVTADREIAVHIICYVTRDEPARSAWTAVTAHIKTGGHYKVQAFYANIIAVTLTGWG
jgi:hypothetical protein